MSTKVTNTDRYAATPDQMLEMMAQPEYLQEKYEALGDLEFTVERQDAGDGSLDIKVDRTVAANMPDLAKKVLGDKNHLVQTEAWKANGDGHKADLVIDSPGKPVSIKGTLDIQPADDGECDYVATFDIKASVPLVGGKLEKMVATETKDNLVKERDFNTSFLAK